MTSCEERTFKKTKLNYKYVNKHSELDIVEDNLYYFIVSVCYDVLGKECEGISLKCLKRIKDIFIFIITKMVTQTCLNGNTG